MKISFVKAISIIMLIATIVVFSVSKPGNAQTTGKPVVILPTIGQDLGDTHKRSFSVTIKSELSEEISKTLVPNFGTVKLETDPSGADVKITDSAGNNAFSGKSPVNAKLSPGAYKVSISAPGYDPISKPLTITKGGTVSKLAKELSLRRQGAYLTILTKPFDDNARVFRNGNQVGWAQSPIFFPVGSASLTVQSVIYGAATTTVIVKDRQDQVLNFELNKSSSSTKSGLFAIKHTYKKLSNGAILQEKTGLIWQAEDAVKKYNHSDAISYCENLNAHGNTDWQLPNREELSSLVDYSKFNPAVDPILKMSPTWYWSYNVLESDVYNAWYVDFENGDVRWLIRGINNNVRCVRSGK